MRSAPPWPPEDRRRYETEMRRRRQLLAQRDRHLLYAFCGFGMFACAALVVIGVVTGVFP